MNVKKIKTSGRLFFLSDIHGELPTLLHGLRQLNFLVGTDTCIHAGDLCDRGVHSLTTLNHFLDDTTGSFHSVLGNHDCFAFQNHNHLSDEAGLWWMNGGQWDFQELDQSERDVLAERVETLPYVIEVEHEGSKYGVVHACVPQDFKSWEEFVGVVDITMSKYLLQSIVWDREYVEFKQCKDFQIPLEGVRYTIHGHTPVKEPLLVGNRWHIDTGLVYGKYLTIAEVVDGELVFHKFDLV